VGKGTASILDHFSGAKAKIGLASLAYDTEVRVAEERQAGEQVGEVTETEAGGIEGKLAALNKTIDDYQASKTAMSDALKYVVAAIAMVITSLVSGPAGPSFIAALLISSGTAAVNIGIDAMVQGRDYDAFKEGVPNALQSIGTDMVTFGLTKGWASLSARLPKTTGGVKNFRDVFGRVGHTVGNAFSEFGTPGDILRTTLAKGLLKPTFDAAVDPLLHLIDPNALKYGWTSTQNEAIQMWSSNAAGLGEEVMSTSWQALLAASGEALTKSITNKFYGEKPTKVPGVSTGSRPPSPASFWASVKKSRSENLTGKKLVEYYGKKYIAYCVKQGSLVVQADKWGDAFDPLLADLEALESRLDQVISTGEYAQLVAELGKGHLEAFLAGVTTEYDKQKKAFATAQKADQDKNALDANAGSAGVDPDTAMSHYKHYIATTPGFLTSDNVTPETFFRDYWPDLQRQIAFGKGTVAKGNEDAFEAWVLADPETASKRAMQASTFQLNIGKANAYNDKQKAVLGSLSSGMQPYAEAMLKDVHSTYDVIKDKGTGPDLTTKGGLSDFKTRYTKMKASAAGKAVEYADPTKQKAWLEHLGQLKLTDWEQSDFLPDAKQADIVAAVAAVTATFDAKYLAPTGTTP
jgi:hypothetical protein